MAYRRYRRRRRYPYFRRRSFRVRSRAFKRRFYPRRTKRIKLGPYLNPRRVIYDREKGKLSDRLFTIQDYSLDWTDSSGSNLVDWVFRGNSPWDPDYTSLSTYTAEKHGLLSSRYQRYCVLGSRCTVTVIPKASGSNDMTLDFVLWPSITNAAGSSDTWEGNRYMKRKICSKVDSKYTLTNYVATKVLWGVKDAIDRDNLTSLASANPVSQWYWHMGFRNMSGALALNMIVSIKIRYYVVWYQPVAVQEA